MPASLLEYPLSVEVEGGQTAEDLYCSKPEDDQEGLSVSATGEQIHDASRLRDLSFNVQSELVQFVFDVVRSAQYFQGFPCFLRFSFHQIVVRRLRHPNEGDYE